MALESQKKKKRQTWKAFRKANQREPKDDCCLLGNCFWDFRYILYCQSIDKIVISKIQDLCVYFILYF